MKNLKKLIFILLCIIGVSSVKAERVFDTTIKIYDYAQILNEKAEKDLKKSVDSYIEKNNIDMVIVTIKHYNQKTLEEYMDLFYNTNKFNESGIMFALDYKKDEIQIKTFGLANELYSESELKKIINKVEKNESNKDKISTFIKYSNKYIDENDSKNYNNEILISIDWIGITIISIVLSTIIVLLRLLKYKQKNVIKRNNNYVKSLIITTKEDSFITTKTKKTRIINGKN